MSKKTEHKWGHREIFDHNDIYRLSKVTILPGEKIPLHYYLNTGEMWNIISGVAVIYISNQQVDEEDDKVQRDIMAKEGQTISSRSGDIINIPQLKVHSIQAMDESFCFIRVEHGDIEGQVSTHLDE